MVKPKQVSYGEHTVTAMRDGDNIYAYHNGTLVYDKKFPTVAAASDFFGRMTSIPVPVAKGPQPLGHLALA